MSRGIFVTGWPHSTATIEEIQNQRQFAVDSWFFDNGEDAVVVPYDAWVAGWIRDTADLDFIRSGLVRLP